MKIFHNEEKAVEIYLLLFFLYFFYIFFTKISTCNIIPGFR